MLLNTNNIKVSNDSRTILPGEYYIPVKGDTFDGYDFIEQALVKGSTGIIEEKQLYKMVKNKIKAINPKIIGITGSVGKTTTKEIVGKVVSQKFNSFVSIENRNTLLGLSIDIINKVNQKHRILILEMGMDRLNEIRDTCKIIHPNISIITNIHENHLEKLKTLKNIINTKAGIMDSQSNKENTIINIDNKNSRNLINRGLTKKTTISVKNKNAGYFGSEIEIKDFKTKFNIKSGDKNIIYVELPVIGEHYVLSSLIAFAVGKILKIPNNDIKKGLESFTSLEGRQSILKGKNGITVIDDTYNASPESVSNLLNVMSTFVNKHKYLILGDMLELGIHEERDHIKVLNEISKFNFDKVFLVGPRFKKALQKTKINKFHCFEDAETGSEKILKLLKLGPDTLIGIKGSRSIRMEKFVNKLI